MTRRQRDTLVLDGRTYRFGLLPAKLALQFGIYVMNPIGGALPTAKAFRELAAHITCDGKPVRRLPKKHNGEVLMGLMRFNFADFMRPGKAKAKTRAASAPMPHPSDPPVPWNCRCVVVPLRPWWRKIVERSR